MGIALLVIGTLLSALGLGYGFYLAFHFQKNKKAHELTKKDLIHYGACLACLTLGGALLQWGIDVHCQWEMGAMLAFDAIAGMALFLPSVFVLFLTFFLYYWKPTLRPDQKKWVRRIMYFAIASTILAFLLLGEGAGPFLAYPLPNSIHIGGSGVFGTYSGGASGGVTITFYGILIVSGALLAYAISDHKMYQKFGRHGVYDTTFIIAFLAGIIGARVGYVIGNWNGDIAGGVNFSEEIAKGNWMSLFAIWEGGLTILGGAIGGIAVGVLVFQFGKKSKDIGARTGIDVAVPTILLAQMIGRWGNFFNHEVYGAEVEMSSLSFLPTWLRNQMATSFVSGVPAETAYVPLFFIEGLANLAGYFIIVYGVGKLLKKWLHRGDLGGAYLMWYGVVRLILEPLRNPSFHMGSDGNWSIVWSIVYIALGALMIAGLHLFDYFYYTKRGKEIPVPAYCGIKEYGWVLPSYERAMAAIEEKKEPAKEETPKQEEAPEEGQDLPLEEGKDEPIE